MLSPWNLSFRTARIAILRGDNIKSPNDRTPPFGVQRGRQLVLSFPHLAADTFAWYKQELRRFKPDILWIYPTGGDFLASLYQQHGASLKIPVVFSSSEMLSADAFGRLQQVFGATVLNYYGQAERVCLAWQTKPHEAWFVPGYGKVELRPTDREAPEGYRAAAVYATSLWNKAMPLVRYNTGDAILYPEAVPDSDLSDIANGLKPFTTLLGRESEYLVTPGGGRIQALNHVPRGVRALRVQLIQHAPERLEIRASPAAGFNSDDEALLLSNARAKIPADIAIEIVTDKPLERTASHKTPFVIRQFQ
jgi:phenylacetate-CoA ligase